MRNSSRMYVWIFAGLIECGHFQGLIKSSGQPTRGSIEYDEILSFNIQTVVDIRWISDF